MRSLVLAVVAVAGCSSPNLSIDVSYDPMLAAFMQTTPVRIQIRAIDADQLAQTTTWPRAAGATGPARCAELELARIPDDVLTVATVAGTRDDTTLTGVPRLGAKLIVAEAIYSSARVGLGCADVGDIDVDLTQPVSVETAARVVQLTALPTAGSGPQGNVPRRGVDLIATAMWDDGLALPGRTIEIDRYDRTGRIAGMNLTTDARGVAQVADLASDTETGPVAAEVRVAGAATPLRTALWHPWPRVETEAPDDGDAVRIPAAPGTRPAGTAGDVDLGDPVGVRWVAAATYHDAQLAPHLIVVGGAAGKLRVLELANPPAGLGAPVIWRKQLYVVDAGAWVQVTVDRTFNAIALEPRVPDPGGPALEAVALAGCNAASPLMLVRRAAAGPYTAYDNPGHEATGFNALVTSIGVNRALSTICVDADDARVSLLLMETVTDDLLAMGYPNGGNRLALPSIAAITDYAGPGDSRRGLVAFVGDTGPRTRSFRFTSFPGVAERVVVPTPQIDVPLSSPPLAIAAAKLDDDDAADVIALVPAAGGARLQVVLDDLVDGEPLTATSELISLGRDAGANAHVLMVDADNQPGDDRDEIVVLSDAGLNVFAP